MNAGVRRLGSGVRALRALARLLASPCATPTQPGFEVFPKRIFESAPDDPPTPGGRSAAYARLSRELRQKSWAQETVTAPLEERWLRRIHRDVLQAYEVELGLFTWLETRR